MIQAEDDLLQLWILLQHPEHGVFRCTAESHIAMALPILWVQGQKGQQINGGFEHIESFTAPSPVKAVSGIATFYITTVAFSLRIDTSFVGVTGNAMLIGSDEYSIVILLGLILGQFPAFIDQPFLGKGIEDLTTDMPLLKQVGIHTAHCLIGGRQGKFFRLLMLLFLCWLIHLAFLTAQQACHCLGVAQTIEGLYKRDRAAALLGLMVVPFAAADGDAVIGGETLIPAGGDELFPLPPQELHQINGVCTKLLLISEVDVGHTAPPTGFFLAAFDGIGWAYGGSVFVLSISDHSLSESAQHGAEIHSCVSKKQPPLLQTYLWLMVICLVALSDFLCLDFS